MSAPAPTLFTAAAAEILKDLGLQPGRPNLDVFAETLLTLARADRNVIAVTSDSRGSGKLAPFAAALPDQLIEVGIAEQNLVGIAAGLASAGKRVFAVSPACFLTARALEQIKNDVCYSDNPVNLIGISAGVSYGALGLTHHSLHDLAALRALPNLEILVPADNVETKLAIEHAVSADHPTYIRFGKTPLYTLPNPPADLSGPHLVRDGKDVAFLATGETVVHALLAAEHLARTHDLSPSVYSIPTLHPFAADAILTIARRSHLGLITVEEHAAQGGLGEATASLLLQSNITPPFAIAALPTKTVNGSQADIFRHHGLSMEALANKALRLANLVPNHSPR